MLQVPAPPPEPMEVDDQLKKMELTAKAEPSSKDAPMKDADEKVEEDEKPPAQDADAGVLCTKPLGGAKPTVPEDATQRQVVLAIYRERPNTYFNMGQLLDIWEFHDLPKLPQGKTPRNTVFAQTHYLKNSGHVMAHPDKKGQYKLHPEGGNEPLEVGNPRKSGEKKKRSAKKAKKKRSAKKSGAPRRGSKKKRAKKASKPKKKKKSKGKKGGRSFTHTGRDKSIRSANAKLNNKKNQNGSSAFLDLSTKAKDQAAQTPASLYNMLDERYGFDFDPCPVLGIDDVSEFNGLKDDWGEMNFCNPPYRYIKKWFAKAEIEQEKGRSTCFLIPFRLHTAYFGKHVPKMSFVEVLPKGVCFKGYKNAIPHPMCTVVFLGKGVEETPQMHMGFPENRLIYRQALPKPHTFDHAVDIVRRHLSMKQEKIHILVNHTNMSGLLSDEAIENATKSHKDAFACLVPFYAFSIAFTKAFRNCQFVAFTSPILSNFEGEGKVRFCSCLFVFCPEDAKLEAMKQDKTLLPMKAFVNMTKYR